MVLNIAKLKAAFANRDKPDQADFSNLIDTLVYMINTGQVLPSEIVAGLINGVYLRTNISGGTTTVGWSKPLPGDFTPASALQVIKTSLDGSTVSFADNNSLGFWCNQAGSGSLFVVGSVLTCRPNVDGTAVEFALATANNANPVVGMVVAQNGDNFLMATHGAVNFPDASTVLDSDTLSLMTAPYYFTPGQLYYLSTVTPGALTPVPPTDYGTYVTASFMATSPTGGVLQVRAPQLNDTPPPSSPVVVAGAADWVVNVNNSVYALASTTEGVYVGGSFTSSGSTTRYRLLRASIDGSTNYVLDPSFKMGGTTSAGTGFNDNVRAIAPRTGMASNVDIYVGGDFTRYNGAVAARLCRLHSDGTLDTGFVPTISFPGGDTCRVLTICPMASADPAADLLVGGIFTTTKDATNTNQSTTRIARIKAATGAVDVSWNTNLVIGSTGTPHGFNDTVWVIKPNAGYTNYYVAGAFTAIGSLTANRIVRLTSDGHVDGTFTAPTINGVVRDIWVNADGSVYIVGTFTQVNGVNRYRIAKLTSAGALDATFNSGNVLAANNDVYGIQQLTVSGNVRLFCMGLFTKVGTTSTAYVASIDPAASAGVGALDGSFLGHANAACWDMIGWPADATKGIVGGNFTTYNGNTHQRAVGITLNSGADF